MALEPHTLDGTSTLSDLVPIRDALCAQSRDGAHIRIDGAVPQVVLFGLTQLMLTARAADRLSPEKLAEIETASPALGAMLAVTGIDFGAIAPTAANGVLA